MCAQLTEAQAARLKALDQLRHAERLSTVGKLSAGLAHELGTPLNVITLRAKAIAGGRATGPRAEEAGKSIAEQATRVTNLVRQLLDFARRRPIQHGRVDVADVIQRTTNLVEPVATKAAVRLEGSDISGPVRVPGDAAQLEQVVTNLVMNAIQAMPDGGRIKVSTRLVEATPPADHGGTCRPWVRIEVEDDGPGIAEAALPHVFEPFFTTKDVGEGTGLGLAVCYGIVQDHGGWIEVATAPGKGTTFAVFLPQEAS
jgi:two-component system NtrC family sensor kinase